MKLMKTLAMVAGLAAGASAYAAGNIYEIVPCQEDGTAIDYPVRSIDNPLVAGDTIYFKVRLARTLAMKAAGDQWKYDYVGIGSPTVDEFFSPLMIGIFVSGKLEYARYVNYVTDASGDVRDFIFSYTTKEGDFALPIRLAGNDGKPAGYGDSASEYLLLNTDKWQIVDASNNPATFQYGNPDMPVTPTYSTGRLVDYTLAESGFYVKSIRFDDNWEDEGNFWRIVNSGGTTTQLLAPRLIADSAPSYSVTLHVWSMDDSIVSISGGTTVDMIVGYDGGTPVKKPTVVGDITFAAGQTVANFTIKGGPAASVGMWTNLVLSAFPNYSFKTGSYERQVDYVTVPVKCTDPLPPTVKATMDIIVGSGNTVYASSDYLEPVATITLSVTEPPTSPFTVTLNPSFSGDSSAVNWWDYVYFADVTELNDEGELSEFSESTKTHDAPTVEFTPTVTTKTFYLIALRSDDRTNRAGHQMKFTPAWTTAPYGDLHAQSAACYIQARPAETSMAKGTSTDAPLSVVCNDPLALKIKVADTYADSITNGYTLTVSLTSTGALVDPDPITNLVVGAGGYLYVANADGTASSTLPTVKYGLSTVGSDPDYFTSSYTLTSPVSGLTSDPVQFYVKVAEKTKYRVAITNEGTGEEHTSGTPAFNEGDEITFTVTLNSPNMLGQTIYAYLEFKTDFDEAAVFEADDEEFIVGMANLEGIPIGQSETVAEGTVRLLDNAPERRLQISKVYFSFDSTLDATNMTNLVSYDYDTANSVTRFTIDNVEPLVSKIKIGTTSLDPSTVYTTKIPLDSERRFTAVVKDVLADLNATNTTPKDLRFETLWTTWCYQIGDGESVDDYTDEQIPGLQFEQMDIDGEGKTLYGNPNNLSFTNTFEVAGIWKICCQLRDKDMDEPSDEYCLYLKVTDAGVSVSQLNDFDETDRSQQLSVSLNYWDNQFAGTVFVALKVKSNAPDSTNLGRLKFNDALLWTNVWTTVDPFELSDAGTVTNAADAAADYYLLSFSSRNQLTQKLSILDADGVNDSFTYNAYVVSAQRNGEEKMLPASGKLAASYYAPSEVCQVTLFNVDPIRKNIRVSPNPDESTNVWTSAKTITWTVTAGADVSGDFAATNGLTVSIIGDGVINNLTTNIHGAASGQFTPNFGSASGSGEIVMTVTDKDGGYQEWVWRYDLPPSKSLVTTPNGPTGIGNSGLSQKYVNADGRGRGHMFVVGANAASAVGFNITWTCTGLSEVPVYGYGYRVGKADNGHLDDGNDQALTDKGAKASKAADANITTGYYLYSGQYGGYEGLYDSYLYAWLVSLPTTDTGTTEWNVTLAPESPAEAAVPANALLPSDTTGDKQGYVPVKVEAAFSREWLPADNLGDINLDGVPDIFAVKYWRNNANLLGRSFNSENDNDINDLIDLAASNPDLDKLPGVYSQSGTLGNVNGYNNSYAPVGIDLATRMEIRGFDTGLNDWLVTKSDISFSDDELFAWTNLITSAEGLEKGYSTTNEQGEVDFAIDPNLTIWTPEPGTALYPRMDPTLEDTDEDGYPDGWEYFFWYQAKVWLPAFDWRNRHENDLDSNGNKLIDPESRKNHLYPGQPRAGQSHTFERFTLDDIVKGVEIPASEVMKRFDPCSPYNAEEYVGAKPLKYDFDNDGLSDLEELVLGTNPCHWDSDGDRLCDAWEVMMCLDPIHGSKNDNPDGDYMAYFAVRHAMCWIDPNAAVTDPKAEGVRIYVMPNLENGIDYSVKVDIGTGTTKYEMLRTVEVTDAFSFTPKFEGPDGARTNVVYGLREDIPSVIPYSWTLGGYMVDRVVVDPIKLQAGTEIFEGHFGDSVGYVLIHDQVRDAFGFDPRTAWGMNGNGYVSNRWDPAHNGKNVNLFSKTGVAINTCPYSNYDEYLVMKYRLAYNIDYSPMTDSDNGYDPNKESMWSFIRRKTTNPSVAYSTQSTDNSSSDGSEGDGTASASTNETAAASIAKAVAAAFNQAGSDKAPITTHGADTDLDGVPDGWELYMYRNPNAGPIADDENPEIPNVDHDDDELSWAEEYAGVDSCDAYKGCESIYKNHPGNNKGWWNKFFPTNPGTMKYGSKTADDGRILYAGDKNEDGADTDGDGVKDALEGGAWSVIFANDGIRFGDHQVNVDLSFVYGNPSDNGLTVCFRGGGMNPCTIDTDLDGLPDGWEMQHAGVPVELPSRNLVTPRSGKLTNVALDDATFIADGVFREGYNLSSNVVYIAGGMDATWGGDAAHDEVNDPEAGRSWDDLLGTARDVDFDHDGLQNYQEYMTQAMRHFRYDDVTTPLMGRILTEGGYHVSSGTLLADHEQSFGKAAAGGSGNGFPVFDPASAENTAANAAEAWYGRSFVYYETVTTGVQKVVKVINDITGESNTNYTYYTAQKKRFKSGATLVADRVAHGGNGYQQPWTADGWRNAGYFAPPRHSWDRATASGKFLLPLYMYPITEGFMVASDISIAGYATTDPRIADTDADGMDDYYEMFHGLNPLLGTTPANANDTEWLVSKGGDIISAQFYMKNINGSGEMTLSTFNAWRNEWIYPSFSGIAGRDGNYLLAGTEWIAAPQAYDPVMYPWGMGSPMVDADGDGVRNDEERILANVADPVHRHTDPTPLWFTERTTPSSYVAQYYVLPDDLKYMPWGGSAATVIEAAALDANAEATHDLYNGMHYAFGFEENEGYDTDGDMTPDSIEFVKMVRSASDPLRFDDPTRRQALYLDGDNSFAMSRDLQLRSVDSEDFLKQFTVECWFRPERTDVEQTIIDRSVAYEGDSINTAMIAVRSNFRIGLTKDGHVYGMFDNNDSIESGLDEPKSCQFVDGGPVQKDTWTHVALTFDGTKLVLYVDGILSASAATTLIPANGVVQILQSPSATNSFTASQYSCAPSAFFVGARPIKATKPSVLPNGVYALYPYYIDPQTGDHLESFDNLQDYFQGYVDEVRVWDGARTSDQILANYKKSIGYAEAKENRDEVFSSWYMNNGTRNNNDGKPNLPAELVLNFDFSTLPGAVDPEDVAKVPAGFYANVLSAASSDYLSNPDIDTAGLYDIKTLKGSSGNGRIEGDLFVGWWKESLLHSTVYSDYRVVPWIKNTVSHLPLADGASPDSFIYSDNFGAVYTPATDLGVSSFAFQNTANPYSSVVFNQDRFYRVAHARIRLVQCGEAYAADYALACFQVRNNFTASADLIPMGGAYAKTCPKLWDEGVADPWEQTKTDTNGDSIPDWWEKYARNNYSPDIDPSASIGWETIVKMKFGDNFVELPAGKAYVIDLYRGMQPGGDIDPAYASNVDADANGIPDWWENLFGVAEYGADDDPDNDGLSNYDEYLLSFGGAPYGLENGFPLLDPANQRTGAGQKVTDYFLHPSSPQKIYADQYLGEIATDHDFMEMWWERENGLRDSNLTAYYSNPFVYDPHLDLDGDGWSNYAEARAYTWYGGFISDIIDSYLLKRDEDHILHYPQPAIGVNVTYYGTRDYTSKTLVVRARTKANGRVDATLVAEGYEQTNDPNDGGEGSRLIGIYPGAITLHGFLNPGYIIPSTEVHFDSRSIVSDTVYHWHCTECLAGGATSYSQYNAHVLRHGKANKETEEEGVVLEGTSLADDYKPFAHTEPLANARTGRIVLENAASMSAVYIGTINYITGEYSIDLEKAAEYGCDLQDNVLRVSWAFQRGQKWPQTVWLSQPISTVATGRIKEGKNIIEAFIDLNLNNLWDEGEPYGMVKDVDIGWHKTGEAIDIELRDESPVMKRTPVPFATEGGSAEGGSEGGSTTAKVVVRRKAINGISAGVPARILASTTVISDDRAYITEADVLTKSRPDLDWNWLSKDAESMELKAVRNATYDVERVDTLDDGSQTNTVIATFTREFNAQRGRATALAPIEYAPVYAARPTFTFQCGDDTMTAYRLQVLDTNDVVVWDSGEVALPGRVAYTIENGATYRVSPELYVDTFARINGTRVLHDGMNYKWRVALLNARFNTVDENDRMQWSDEAYFQMDVRNKNYDRNPDLKTGYGIVAAAVRYYGAGGVTSTEDGTTNIIVEAYASADFTGIPLARMRVDDLGLLSSVTNVTTTNVVLRGLAPGEYFLVAFVDANNNGKRDAYESWGYANYVGEDTKFLYIPKAVEVTDTLSQFPDIAIFIEDTDVNQNETPDCLELESFMTLAVAADDSDRDGLDSAEEADIGTDPSVWDTDIDGMPDGWEIFTGRDPLFDDAEEGAGADDVMAYAEIEACLVTVKDAGAAYDEGAVYAILDTSVPVPNVGDNMAGKKLVTTYDYGHVKGVGREVTLPAGNLRVTKVEANAKVALVHAQVYDWFGFNPKTCVADDDAVNTKVMTALDKYLVVRYLEAIGVRDAAMAAGDTLEDWVNRNRKWDHYTLVSGVIDGDWSYDLYTDRRNGDGIADGWELYVMFQPDGVKNGVIGNSATIRISPWVYGDARTASPSNENPAFRILDEYDGGNVPTDPWQTDSDRDGINDYVAWKFQIKSAEMQLADLDDDGLSNWAEYLATQAGYGTFDVYKPYSVNTGVLDYFVKTASGLYVGESLDNAGTHLIADHDFMEDAVEDMLGFNRYVYDANRDLDANGWDNWSEVRARYDEGTWVQVGTETNLYTVTFDMDSPDRSIFVATNQAEIASVENLSPWHGWQLDIENPGGGSRSSYDTEIRYTLVGLKSIMAYGGRPRPNISLKIYGMEGEASNVVVTARSAGGYETTLTGDGTVTPDGAFTGVFTGEGLRQGLNTFVVTSGDKIGFVRDVDVGYNGASAEIRLGTSDLYFALGVASTNAAERVRIVRTAVNGMELSRKRTLWAKKVAAGENIVFTPMDLIRNGDADFDARWLVYDAAANGISTADIRTVEYGVFVGDAEEPVYSFMREFSGACAVPVASDVYKNLGYKVLTAQPEFVWAGDDGYPAFALQIARDEAFGNIVYETTGAMPALRADGYHFKPAAYVGKELADNTKYYWRVAMLNAKFTEPVWSEAAEFMTAVNSGNADTGYGAVAADVRYYGPATAGDVLVAAYASPDFAGVPAAVKPLGKAVNSLAYVAAAGADWMDVHANVVLDGLAPGDWYLMAFVDRNGNGVRDPYETWGYVCKIADGAADRWTPVALTAAMTKQATPAALLVMEDTDVNQNMEPDCKEDMSDWSSDPDTSGRDLDRDGLDEAGEEDNFTDPMVWDTDGDGMPDGWEAEFGDTDPMTPDADVTGDDADVMAYAEVDAYLVTIRNFADVTDAGTVYALIDIPAVAPAAQDKVSGQKFWTIYAYGAKTGVGREVQLPAENAANDWRIVAVDKSASVVLVHAQVYERFGFNAKTCVAGDDAVNTKKMTALDKYLVVRYLEAIGVEPTAVEKTTSPEKWVDCYGLEDWVNVNRRWADYTLMAKNGDLDLDSVRDGWELYVMFGPYNEPGNAAFHFAADKKASPWIYNDRTSDFDGDELPLCHEYDGGYWPTDPWNVDTDGDHVFDVYAYAYHLKGDDAGKDADGDGLSNYAEYIISEVFQYVKLDPDNAMTSDSTLDYYRKFGDLYLGELFTDHDRIDDDWEAQYEKGNLDGKVYAARGIYDPDLDLDNDGWSNYAEFRAGTSPALQTSTGIDNYTLVEHPVPVVQMEVVYNGTADIEGKTLTVKAWNEQRDSNALMAPDATWTVTTLNEIDTATLQNAETGEEVREKYVGRMPTGKRTYYLGGGSVKEGSFKLCIKDKNYVEGSVISIFGQNYFQATGLGDSDAALWFYDVVDYQGTLVTRGGIFAEAHTVGSIDYDTGRVTIDFDDEEFTDELFVGDPEKDAADSDTNKGNGQNATQTYHGLNPPNSYVKFVWSPVANVPVRGVHYLGDTDSGFLREGLTTFIVEASSSSDSGTVGGKDSTSGAQTLSVGTSATLYGVVRNVDVGWAGAKFTVELTDYNPITPRMDLVSGTADRVDSAPFGDYRWGMQSNRLEAAEGISETIPTRVRVVRYAINGYPVVKFWSKNLADVVYDKTWSNPDRKFCELDFLLDGRFDIDWTDTFNTKVATENGVALGSNGDAGNIAQVIGTTAITNIEYLVVIGDGPTAWERGDDTNTVVTARVDRIVRRFDRTRAKPVPVSVDGIQYSARPTFKWRMDGEDPLASRFGSSYTAFKLQVLQGGNTVYDSGIRRAPKVDDAGNFVWTAPICAGSMLPSGAFYDTVGESAFTWRVIMYNAMFRSDSNDYWSDKQGILQFATSVNAQQELNDHGYSSIAVAVRYAGSSIVLAKSADMTTTKGKVIVQAFSTPDFSGDPLSAGMAMSDVAELARPDINNAWLKGLPAIGTYYVRAFIDMDGDGKLSEWEPWGYVADAVTLANDGTMVEAPFVSVWIEDSDSDGDWIPDAYEYAAVGWTVPWEQLKGNKKLTSTIKTTIVSDGEVVLPFALNEKITAAAISLGLPGVSLTAMQSENFVSALLGLDLANKETIEAIFAAAKAKLDPKSVKVVAFSLTPDGKKVNLSVGADVASGISGTVIEKIYEVPASKTVKVNVKVFKKTSLDDSLWTEFYTTPNPVEITSEMYGNIEVPLGEGVDLSSGFFKVELEEVE